MLHPSYTDLMNIVNSEAEEISEAMAVNSRYSIVMAASKRARQLVAGAEPLAETKDSKPLSVAIQEIYDGKVMILNNDEE